VTLLEIASFINQNTRFKLTEAQILILVDNVQKLAFDHDMIGFKYWEATQQIYVEISFQAGSTDPVASDIGKAVVGGTSGTSGTLISYNTTTDKWVVDVGNTANYTDGEVITITAGTGTGTLLAADAQVNFKGPYAFPTTVPVRKMIGMTTNTDPRIFGTEAVYLDDLNDYGLVLNEYDERKFYKKARVDIFAKTMTLINEPNRDTDTYRWVYFRKPETITDLSADDSKMLIPEEFHMNFVQACIAQANVTTEDGRADRQTIEGHFYDWWQQVQKAYTPMGTVSNQTNQGDANTDAYV
jgi:hypothetical protein